MNTVRSHVLRRRALALGVAVALSATVLAAHAADECGPSASGVTVVCAPMPDPYTQVQYENVTDFDLLLKSGVVIDGKANPDDTTGLRVWGKGNITVTAEEGVAVHNEDA